MQKHEIAVIRGDGIGIEVVEEGLKVLNAVGTKHAIQWEFTEYPWGSDYYFKHNEMMPTDGLNELKSKEAISVLFGELAERYKDRQGGYSRIIKLGKTRLGDNSEMAIVQLIGSDKDTLSSLKSKSGKNKNPKRKLCNNT